MLLVWFSQQRHRGVKPSGNASSEGAEAACAGGFSRLGSRWGWGWIMEPVVFLTLKIRVISYKFLILFSDMQAQQISVFCCWPVHVLQTVISVSKNGLYSEAAGAGDPVSILCEEALFLHSLWYDYVMTSEVYVLSLERCLGDIAFKVSFLRLKDEKNPTKQKWLGSSPHPTEEKLCPSSWSDAMSILTRVGAFGISVLGNLFCG